jgi:hypothetical protein
LTVERRNLTAEHCKKMTAGSPPGLTRRIDVFGRRIRPMKSGHSSWYWKMGRGFAALMLLFAAVVPSALATGTTVGPDSALWFTEGANIVRIYH